MNLEKHREINGPRRFASQNRSSGGEIRDMDDTLGREVNYEV
jgi:hypothetical protein